MKKPNLVFHIIGYKEVGLGHIYRSLSLAKELDEFDISFACAEESSEMAELLIRNSYDLFVFQADTIFKDIAKLYPDIVINDVLYTEEKHIRKLKERNIKIINFEDLGTGSIFTDLTINELYENPEKYEGNILWGHKYFFLREEFLEKKPNQITDKIRNVLITYGGTDSNNLTKYTFDNIYEYCYEKDIFIYIVSGPGYQHYSELEEHLRGKSNVRLTHATGVISEIMQKVQIALTSNGRTVFELAHMNIPSIVISQHRREAEHKFSSDCNGMINIGVFDQNRTKPLLISEFKKMVEENSHYKKLYNRTAKLNFSRNKIKVIELIRSVINE